MPSQKNIQQLARVQEKVDRAQAMFFVDYQGLTHKQLEEARRELKNNASEIAVIKNTLLNLALKEKNVDASQKLTGAHATLFSYEDPVKTVKVLFAFFKKYLPANKKMSDAVKFGVFGGEVIDEATISRFATLPGREVLLGKLAALLNSPINNLVYDLNWTIQKFVLTLKAIEDKKSKKEVTIWQN